MEERVAYMTEYVCKLSQTIVLCYLLGKIFPQKIFYPFGKE